MRVVDLWPGDCPMPFRNLARIIRRTKAGNADTNSEPGRARVLGVSRIIVPAMLSLVVSAKAADRPLIESVGDRDSAAVLWSSANSTAMVTLKPGQETLI